MASKMKTHKGLLKRVKLTKNGKILRRRAGGSHLMSAWNGRVSRRLRVPLELEAADRKKIICLMGNPKYFR